MLNLAGFEAVRRWHEILWPLPLGGLADKFLVRFWPFNELALTNFLIARLQPEPPPGEPAVSVIVPARNESGNIKAIFERTPKMGVRQNWFSSRDIHMTIRMRPSARNCRPPSNERPALPPNRHWQSGRGSPRLFQATGDILMILDADLTVPPEELPLFYEELRSA